MNPIWSGVISFGLVTVRVQLAPSVRSHDIRFHQVDRATGRRIRHLKVVEGSEPPTAAQDLVKAAQTDSGQLVTVDPKELEALAATRSKTITISEFVVADEVDPVYFDTTYYVAPLEGFEQAYRLLAAAMESQGRSAVATFVMRTRQHLALLTSREGVLRLSTLHYADEVLRPPQFAPSATDDRLLSTAQELIGTMTEAWRPTDHVDTYREQIVELLESKATGAAPPEVHEQSAAPVLDLMEALRRSVERAQPSTSASPKRRSRTGEPTKRGRSGSPPVDEDFSSWSRDELYRRAQSLDIPGRSKMSVEELRIAVARATAEVDEARRRAQTG